MWREGWKRVVVKISNGMKRDETKKKGKEKSVLRRGRPEKESEERDERKLFSMDQKNMNKEMLKLNVLI